MERVGEESYSTSGHRMKIIEYRTATDITIQWECGNTQIASYRDFKKGSIRYPLHKGFLGKGYLGFGRYTTGKPKEGQIVVPKYITDYWRYMLHRVYNGDYLSEKKKRRILDNDTARGLA